MNFLIGERSRNWAEKSQIPSWYEPTATSTNRVAKEHSLGPAPITLYLTEHQTEGRGRGTHTWTDQPSGSLLSSWVFQLSRSPQPVLAPAVGLALWTALRASFPALPWSLKAPNDLYLGHQKIAGLLIENVQQGNHHRLIVGLGLNVWSAPAEIAGATALLPHIRDLSETTWINVLDRLLLEMSLAISQTREILSPHQCECLLFALNQYPGLPRPYAEIDPKGSQWL